MTTTGPTGPKGPSGPKDTNSQESPDGPWWEAKDSLEKRLAVYDQFRKYIQHEDGLINNRLSWMLTIHGFLYAAYALAITKQQDTLVLLATSVSRDNQYPPQAFVYAVAAEYELLFFFMGSIAAVGFFISLLGGASILAAIASIGNVARIFRMQSQIFEFDRGKTAAQQSKEPLPLRLEPGKKWLKMVYRTPEGVWLPRMAGGSSRRVAQVGSSAATFIPLVLLTVWAVSVSWSYFHQVDIRTLYESPIAVSDLAPEAPATDDSFPVTSDNANGAGTDIQPIDQENGAPVAASE